MAARTLHLDRSPFRVRSACVTPVNLRDIPVELRAHAATVIDALPMDVWHTIGVFTEEGETLTDTAVVRRTYRGDKIAMEYGVES